VKPVDAAALLLGLAACSSGGSPLSLPRDEQGAARASASYALVYSFRGPPDGYVPNGGLISDDSGHLYGVTYYGGVTPRGCNGSVGCGTFFTYNPSSRQETVLYSFGRTQRDGQVPSSLLFYEGSFYGTTQDGGTNADLGTVFKITPPAGKGGNWQETVLHRFHGSPDDAASPVQLTIDASGAIYGTAGNGGAVTNCFQGCGAIFKLTRPPSGKGEWRERILYSFAGPPDGEAPSSLILAPNGTFYGETNAGGRSTACGNDRGCGTIFALKPSGSSRWTETILHSFKAAKAPKDDGEFPFGGLLLMSNGALYGVTTYGGPLQHCYTQGYPWSGCGTFFRIQPTPGQRGAWTESILYRFKGDAFSAGAPDSITLQHGDFYGTTVRGGSGDCDRGVRCGTLFDLIPSRQDKKWTEAIMHAFMGGANDGWDPGGPIVADHKNLYGVTMYGGSGSCPLGCGTIYEYEP
jgi:uncharacterized repeat protein (TIGR03803 family)